MSRIKVLIVDDSVTIRAMLEEIFGREADLELVGSAADADEALLMIQRSRPDVVMIDIAMPGKDGLSLLDSIHLTTHAVMLTSRADARDDAIERGALGFFNKADILKDPARLLKMVRKAAEGKKTRKVA